MGSMDTSRISQFLGLTPKIANVSDDTASRSGGFADMLFGVMSKRVSTAQSPVSSPKVSTVLPLDAHPGSVERPAVERPARPERNVEVVGKTGESALAGPRAGTEKPVADKAEEKPSSKPDDRCGTAEVVDAAQALEAGDLTEETGEEVDFQSGADGTPEEDAATNQEHTGETPNQNSDPQAEAALIAPMTLVTATPATEPSLAVEGVAPTPVAGAAGEDSEQPAGQPAVPATGVPAEPQETTPEFAAAQPALPETQTEAAADDIQQIGAQTASPAEKAAAAAAAQAVEATLALSDDNLTAKTEAEVGLLTRQSDRRGEDQSGDFRRSAGSPRQRNAAAGQGTAANPAAPAANAQAAVVPTAAAKSITPAATTPGTVLPLNPLGLDTGLGSMTGLPGWTMNLAQGNAAKRPEFIAQLRQHLQNLPVHDQVALGIQRTARDGGGRITLELSPSELGRIHVKLDIDEENNARAAVSVERPATLDLLQKDLKALERALQDAGLKMDQGALSLSLQGGDSEAFGREFGSGGSDLAQIIADGGEDDLPTEMMPAAVIATGEGMVDVQV